MSRKSALLVGLLMLALPLASNAGGGQKGKGGSATSFRASGVVASLATGSFSLQYDNNKTVDVLVATTTKITKASDGSATTLSVGWPVSVSGTYDSTAKAVTATTVVVNDRKTNVRVPGTIANLATDGSSFALQFEPNQTVTVDVVAATKATDLSDGSAAILANGLKVLVAGSYDPLTKIVTAATIVVDDRKPVVHVAGTTSALAADGSFTLTYESTRTVAVTVSTTTKVTKKSDGSATTVADGEYVLVTGPYDSSKNTVAATAIVVDDVKPTVKLRGTVANLAADDSSFAVQADRSQSVTIDVATTTTVTKKSDGMAATLANGQIVLITGAFDPATNTVAATSIVVDDLAALRPQEAEGTIASIDPAAGTLVLTVTHASFTPTGPTIGVSTTTKTVVLAGRGKGTFASLAVGTKVEVVGPFNAASQQLAATVISVAR